MPLLKDLIDLPEHIHKGDFVPRLSEGVHSAEETFGDYVVTPELTRCFDAALAFIPSAIQECYSKAIPLHGNPSPEMTASMLPSNPDGRQRRKA